MIDISLLGTGGMMPLPNRYLTALMLRCNGHQVLVDCGEGTQVSLRMLGWSFKSIDAICFTHYHGDHIAGLPGLLLSIGNADRTEPLTLVGPKGLKRVVEGLLLIAPELPFKIIYKELSNEPVNEFKIHDLDITAYKVEHGMLCVGYSFNLSRLPKFEAEKAEKLNLPKQYWGKLQKGFDVEYEGQIFTPDMVLGSDRKGLKISYCTDSRPTPHIVDQVREADLFICEGMYGELDKQENAKKYKHMTFYEAADMAQKAEVKELWLTHFSPSLVDPYAYKAEVKKVFGNTHIGKERKVKTLHFKD